MTIMVNVLQVDKTNSGSVGDPRTKLQAEKQLKIIRQQTTTKAKKEKSTMYGLRDVFNTLHDLSLDVYQYVTKFFCYYIFHDNFRSSPVECLHTILLGPVKYFLKELMERLTPQEKDLIVNRINSFNFSGIQNKINGNSICRSAIIVQHA